MLDSWWSFCLPRRYPLSRWHILYCLLSSIRNSLPGLFMILKLSLPSEYIKKSERLCLVPVNNITASHWIWICKGLCQLFVCESVFNSTLVHSKRFLSFCFAFSFVQFLLLCFLHTNLLYVKLVSSSVIQLWAQCHCMKVSACMKVHANKAIKEFQGSWISGWNLHIIKFIR